MKNETLVIPAKPGLMDNVPVIVLGMLLIDSLHFVFARLLLPHLPPMASAMYILTIGTVEVAIFAQLTGRMRFAVLWQNLWFFTAIGFLVAASTALNYMAVAFIDPGTASMLGKASVVFGLGFGLLWLRDHFNRIQFGGAALALLGVFIITFQPGDYLRLGAFMVVGSAFMYALHAALVKRYGNHLGLVNFFLFRLAATSMFLFVFAAASRNLAWPDGQTWLLLIFVATLDVVISRTLYYTALRHLKMSLHSLIMTLSPVITIGWSLFLFGSSPTVQQLAGGAAVLLGILVVTLQQKRRG